MLGYIGFAALGTSGLVALWDRRRLWLYLLILGLALGVAGGGIATIGLVAAMVMGLCCVTFGVLQARGAAVSQQIAAGAAVVIVALPLALHLVPGFRNIVVIDHQVLKPGAVPFTLALNFDKTLAGAMVLGWCWRRPAGAAGVRRAVMLTVATAVLVVIALMGLGTASGYVRWEPTPTGALMLFMPVNLVVCMSEEAFFRGFLQTQWMNALPGSPAAMGILASGILFGVAHLAGGWLYVGLASVAGIGYALVYHLTRRLECSVVTHWSVNTLHFALFSYPALASRLH
jgi:hypothetical protein